MDPLSFTRQLIDIESITGNEAEVGEFLERELKALGWHAARMAVAPQMGESSGPRFNVYAVPPDRRPPQVVLSTHMDTVPPFIPSSEDADRIYGRGACDAKGIIAAQIAAGERLRGEGVAVGLLFLVGEERNSQGAMEANRQSPGSKFLINGEPTNNRLAIASKGSLRVELTARGKMAHSAYPELGESAIEKLLDVLQDLRAMPLPRNDSVGPCTMNIGVIEGGRAPNVIPDLAHAQLMYRMVVASEPLKQRIVEAVGTRAEVDFVLDVPFMPLRTLPGIATMVAAFTTDVPALTNWGDPLLIGPGSIHVAHTELEFIDKRELLAAVELYVNIVQQLLK
jgi:acetylornithine deacetylase